MGDRGWGRRGRGGRGGKFHQAILTSVTPPRAPPPPLFPPPAIRFPLGGAALYLIAILGLKQLPTRGTATLKPIISLHNLNLLLLSASMLCGVLVAAYDRYKQEGGEMALFLLCCSLAVAGPGRQLAGEPDALSALLGLDQGSPLAPAAVVWKPLHQWLMGRRKLTREATCSLWCSC